VVSLAGRELLLDSNVLLLLFVGLFDRSRIARFKNTEQFTSGDFDLLLEFIGRFSAILATPHIFTEVSNLAGQLGEPARSELFAILRERLLVLAEEHVPATTAASNAAFIRLGLTDSAIASLTVSRPRCSVLTTDFDLWVYLVSSGIDATNFNHLRSSLLR